MVETIEPVLVAVGLPVGAGDAVTTQTLEAETMVIQALRALLAQLRRCAELAPQEPLLTEAVAHWLA